MPAEFKGYLAKDLSMGFVHWKTQKVTRANRNIVVALFEDEEGEFLTLPFFAKEKGVSEWLLQYEGEDQDVVLDALEEAYNKTGDYPIAPLFGSKARVQAIIQRGHRQGYVYFELDKIQSLPFSDGMAWIADPIAPAKKSKKGKSTPTISRGKTPAKKETTKTPAKETVKKEAATPPPLFVVTSNSTFTPEPPKREEPVKEEPVKEAEPVKEPVVSSAIEDKALLQYRMKCIRELRKEWPEATIADLKELLGTSL